jgi:hypothetical protein
VSLNPEAKIFFSTALAQVLRADKDSFSILVRWTSHTFKDLPSRDTEASVDHNRADGTKAKQGKANADKIKTKILKAELATIEWIIRKNATENLENKEKLEQNVARAKDAVKRNKRQSSRS